MNIKPRLNQKQSLALSLNPKLIQMFNIFHLSYADLLNHIKQEQDDNVFIEVSQSDSLMIKSLTKQSSVTSSDTQATDLISSQDYQSIRDFALSQLNYSLLTKTEKHVLTLLIDSLNDNGFILNWTEASTYIKKSLSVSQAVIDKCLAVLQEFEPDGIGARSLEECLTIQLDHLELDNMDLISLLNKVIKRHLTDLADQNYKVIAKSCNIPIEGVTVLADFIKTNFNPNPGASFSNKNPHYITPSFQILFSNDNLTIQNLEVDKGISINLSETYLQTLEQKDLDVKTKQFLTEKYQKAKDMIQFINQRRVMLETLMSTIAKKQVLYFQKGPDFLIPLLQKDIAKELSLSPSTVSRILSSKFCQTQYGTIPLKVLCPRNYFGKTKAQFIAFIAYFLKENPQLSDNKIAMMLKEKGIHIARRTVTKYRNELGLVSSYFKGRSKT